MDTDIDAAHEEQVGQAKNPVSYHDNSNVNGGKRMPKYVFIIILLIINIILALLFGMLANATVGGGEKFLAVVSMLLSVTPFCLMVWLLIELVSRERKVERQQKVLTNSPRGRIRLQPIFMAIVGAVITYVLCMVLTYITSGIILLPIEEWTSFSEPIPFVNTVHFIIIALLVGVRVFQKNNKK